MYQDRRIAALYSAMYLIPLGGAITLLALRWMRYWIDYTSDISTTLQFVAKLHELLMQVSLLDVLLCIVRTGAVNGFVPFGALSGAAQATQLSYLWSIDFVSMYKSSAFQGWRKALILLGIPLVVVLIALVGPSSAVLMIPRTGSPYVVEVVTRYLSQSVQSLYPPYLDKSHNLNW